MIGDWSAHSQLEESTDLQLDYHQPLTLYFVDIIIIRPPTLSIINRTHSFHFSTIIHPAITKVDTRFAFEGEWVCQQSAEGIWKAQLD